MTWDTTMNGGPTAIKQDLADTMPGVGPDQAAAEKVAAQEQALRAAHDIIDKMVAREAKLEHALTLIAEWAEEADDAELVAGRERTAQEARRALAKQEADRGATLAAATRIVAADGYALEALTRWIGADTDVVSSALRVLAKRAGRKGEDT